MYKELRKPTPVSEAKNDLMEIDQLFFITIVIKDDKTFMKFKDGVCREINKQDMIEMINQLSIGLMMENIQ